MRIEVTPASRGQEPILANLLELYIHDFSEFHPVQIGPDGRFGYDKLPLYWSNAGRFPYLITVDGSLAGFAFVKRGSEISGAEDVWDLAEFFVLRAYRRLGVGKDAAHAVWLTHAGKWEVRVLESNAAARQFWERAGRVFAGDGLRSDDIEKDGRRWTVFSLESKRG